MPPTTPRWLARTDLNRWYAISGDRPDLDLQPTPPGTRYLKDNDPACDPQLNPARTLKERLRRLLGRDPKSPWHGVAGFSAITEGWNSAASAADLQLRPVRRPGQRLHSSQGPDGAGQGSQGSGDTAFLQPRHSALAPRPAAWHGDPQLCRSAGRTAPPPTRTTESRSALEPIEHFACARNDQHPVASTEGRDVDRRRVPIAEIDPPAALG